MIMKSQPKKRKGKKPGPRPGSKYRHGGFSLLTRGVKEGLPEKRRYIGHYLSTIREGLIHDLAASEKDLSTAQKVLIDRAITFLGVVRLIEEHARQHGVLDARGRLSSGLTGHYLSFNRHIKEILAILGIDKRKSEEVLSPLEYIRQFDKEEEKDKEK